MKVGQWCRMDANHYLFVLVLTTLCHIAVTIACPKECFCPQHSQNVHCSRNKLPSIPLGIPFDTVELNLNDNNFENQVLSRRNFTNLFELENLYLSNCGIKTIALETFTDLKKLKWLDISKNNIEFLADFTFRGLVLKHLFLNENPGIQLSDKAFEGLSTQGLYIHKCELTSLSYEAMKPLDGTLKSLWLDENKFEKFPFSWLQKFNLSHLRLAKNPFHCNCEITWLHKYYTENTSVFSGIVVPTCTTPSSNAGKSFLAVKDKDFRCELPTFQNVEALFELKQAVLTCNASGDPTPTLHWIRPDGTTDTFYPSEEDDVRDNNGVMIAADPHDQDRSLYKCVASNPAGNVTFTLTVVWPEKESNPTTETPHIGAESTVPPIRAKPLGGGDKSYDWTHNKAEKKLGIMSEDHSVDGYFTIVDIVGAVVGTFLLTLLICAVVFHFYYKRRERLKFEEEQANSDSKRSPNNLYHYMAEPDENCLKMINHSNDTNVTS